MNIESTLRGYVACALWSSTDDNGDPLDDGRDYDDLPAETLAKMRADVTSFVTTNRVDITCANSTPEMDGDARWSCAAKPGGSLSPDKQRVGCTQHRYIPILLDNFAKQKDFVDGDVVYESTSGLPFANGEQPASFTSQEIRDLENKSLIGETASLKAQLASQGIESTVAC